jgi:5-formyltetrahydrofolate cyclo-ligase
MDRATERAKMRMWRKRYVAEQGDVAIRQACEALALLAGPHLAPYSIIGSYWAVGSEINPAPLEAQLRRAGHIIALPRVTDRETPLHFARHEIGDIVEAGPVGGIPQPTKHASVVRPDALLVPLLAVDARGFRLGQGAGYYDRTIAALRPVYNLGLAHDCQIVDRVTDAPWDEPLDALVTPTRWITCRPKRGSS